MTDPEEFRRHAHRLVDWMADYYKHIERFSVKSNVQPGEIFGAIPDSPPASPEAFDDIFRDFEQLVLPGITHWQHPGFHAYFNANTSFPSILGEMLTATLGAQCMLWETSPAATELEEKIMEWLKEAFGLPSHWSGVIQDTASTATLCALLSARERITNFQSNALGIAADAKLTGYCSSEAHASVIKGAKIAGYGDRNVRRIDVDHGLAMDAKLLEETVQRDLDNGFTPAFIVAAAGTTGTLALDPLKEAGEIARKYGIWYHVDAAYLGNAGILPEYRHALEGIEAADSYVFNPHKWLFTNFDLSAYFVKDRETLIRTFELTPEYLKTGHGQQVNNYKDWGIQLGRRFRALKLWFVLRSFGLNGIREKFREHIRLAKYFHDWLERHADFELMAPRTLNVVCFRYNPGGLPETVLDETNSDILHRINATGKAYITHTKVKNRYTIRFVVGQSSVELKHIQSFIQLLEEIVSMRG
jgi:aromatic-L-amino-acid decarboxylase